MAKGDFIFAGVDTKTYTSARLRGKHKKGDGTTAGLTLVYLFVDIDVACIAPQPKEGDKSGDKANDECDKKNAPEDKKDGEAEKGGGEEKKDGDEKKDDRACVCKGKISNYELLVKSYTGNDLFAGLPQRSTLVHELYHVEAFKKCWEKIKKELDTLLDPFVYECEEYCKFQMLQDVFLWFLKRLLSEEDEEHVRVREMIFRDLVAKEGGTVEAADKVIDGILGKKRLKENENLENKRKVKVEPNYLSRVYPTFKGKCWK